jgi:hypothetical protein
MIILGGVHTKSFQNVVMVKMQISAMGVFGLATVRVPWALHWAIQKKGYL